MDSLVLDALHVYAPGYEKTFAFFEKLRTVKSEKEIQDVQQEIIKVLEKEDNVNIFKEQCKQIGQTAAATKKAFQNVKDSFDKIKNNPKYIKEFPEIIGYANQWDGFRATWDNPGGNGLKLGLLWTSRELANETATNLEIYEEAWLKMVQEIENEMMLEDAKKELENYSKQLPTVGRNLVDDFLKLQHEIDLFAKDFQVYLDKKKQELDGDAIRYKDELDRLTAILEGLENSVKQALLAVECAAAFGPGPLLIAVGVLAGFIIARNNAQKDVDDAQGKLDDIKNKQKILATIQAEYLVMQPNITAIINNLSIFAQVWANSHAQAGDIATKLEGGMKVLTTTGFKSLLKLAIVSAKPLREGMRIYATQVTPVQSED